MGKRRDWRRWLALLAVLAVLVSACGGGDDDAGDEDSSGDEDFDPNGVLRIGQNLVASSAGNLDPSKTVAAGNFDLVLYVYDTLLHATETGFEPGLAEEIVAVDDQTVSIKLRAGVTFSDGAPFDAAAVRGGLLRAVESKGRAYKPEFLFVSSIDVKDSLSLIVNLSQRVAGEWIFLMASGEGMIPSPKAIASGVDLTTNPVGAGPFMLDQFQPGQMLRLKKNPEYFEADKIKLAAIEFKHVGDASALLNGMLSGDIDVNPSVTVFSQVAQLEAAGIDVVTLESESTATSRSYIKINLCLSQKPFDDIRVREALSLAVNRDQLNQAIYNGKSEVIDGGAYPKDSPFYDESLGRYTRYDPARAQRLLADAGFGPSNPLTFDAFFTAGEAQQVMEIVQQDWKKVGVTVNIAVTQDLFNEFLIGARRPVGAHPMGDKGLGHITSTTRVGTAFNVCQYNNPAFESTLRELAAADRVTPSDEALQLTRDLQALAYGDYRSVETVFRPVFYAANEKVGGLRTWSNSATYALFPDVRYAFIRN